MITYSDCTFDGDYTHPRICCISFTPPPSVLLLRVTPLLPLRRRLTARRVRRGVQAGAHVTLGTGEGSKVSVRARGRHAGRARLGAVSAVDGATGP